MIGGKQNNTHCPECRQPKNKDDMTTSKVGGKDKEVCKACEYRIKQGGKGAVHV